MIECNTTLSESTTNALVSHIIKQEVFNSFRREVAQFEERWRKSVSKLTQSIEFFNNKNVILNNNTVNINTNNDINDALTEETRNLEEHIQNELPLSNKEIEKNYTINKNDSQITDKNKLNFFIVENNLTDIVELQPVVLKAGVSETVRKNIEHIKQMEQNRIERQKKSHKKVDEKGLDEYVFKNRKKYDFKIYKHRNRILTTDSQTKLNKELISNNIQQINGPTLQNITPAEKQKHVNFQTDKDCKKVVMKNNKKDTIDKIYNNQDNKKCFVKSNTLVAERDITDLEKKYFDKLKSNNKKGNLNCLCNNKNCNKKNKTEIWEKNHRNCKKSFKHTYKKGHKCNIVNICSEQEEKPYLQSKDRTNNNNNLSKNKQRNKRNNLTQELNHHIMQKTTEQQIKNTNFEHQKWLKEDQKRNIILDSKEITKKENFKLYFKIDENTETREEILPRKHKNKKIKRKKKITQVIKKKQKKDIRFFSPYMKQLNVFNNRTKNPKLIKILYNKYREVIKNTKEETKKCSHIRSDGSPRLSSIPVNKIIGVPLQPFTQELENNIKTSGSTQLENFYMTNRNKLGGLYFLVSSLIFRNDNNISNFDLNSEFNDHKLGKPVWLDPDPRPNGFGPLKPRPHATYRRILRPRPPPQEYVLFFGDPNINLYTVEAT